MGGGMLNLISTTTLDVILTGNPDITFFKKKYRKYVNFGMQYFRLECDSKYNLDYNNETYINFTVPRYADLINDSYLVINLPDIYSEPPFVYTNKYCPKFKWIRDLGFNIIKKVSITIGGQLITEYSGEYLINLRDRENNDARVEKINQMTGNVPELYDPKSVYSNKYPNAFKDVDYEPSIRGRKLYIPLNAWFCNDPSLSIPLISLQYQAVNIKFELRPIKELFVLANEIPQDYINNFLFNEYPDMHNINFIVKMEDVETDISTITEQIYEHMNSALSDYSFNYLYKQFSDANPGGIGNPDTSDLMIDFENYSRSIITFVKNANNKLPNTPQHVGYKNFLDPCGDCPPDSDTNEYSYGDCNNKPNDTCNEKIHVKSYRIDKNNKFVKIYVYIDRLLAKNKNFSDCCNSTNPDLIDDPANLQNLIYYNNLGDITEQFDLIATGLEKTTILPNSYSQYVSSDILGNKVGDNEDFKNEKIDDRYQDIPDALTNKIDCESSKQYLLQNQYKHIKNYIEYVAPDCLDVTDSNGQHYSINEIFGNNISSVDMSLFLLNPTNVQNSWEADIHIISKYVFLDEKERVYFAKRPQSYLIKINYEEEFLNLNVPNSLNINSKDLVVNYMWTFKRSDVYKRNEWSNYTNWKYIDVPNVDVTNIGSGSANKYFITPYIADHRINNKKEILKTLSIIIDGKIREEVFDRGVYNYIEKYLKCEGRGRDGQYFYSFALNNSHMNTQPTGSMNLSKYNDITFEFTLIEPPINDNFNCETDVTIDTIIQIRENGSAPICVSKKFIKDTKLYTYNMNVHQERYNILLFNSGMAGLQYAR